MRKNEINAVFVPERGRFGELVLVGSSATAKATAVVRGRNVCPKRI